MRFFVREHPLGPIQGTFSRAEIRTRLLEGKLPPWAEWLAFAGQTEHQLRRSDHWRPLCDLLGEEEPWLRGVRLHRSRLPRRESLEGYPELRLCATLLHINAAAFLFGGLVLMVVGAISSAASRNLHGVGLGLGLGTLGLALAGFFNFLANYIRPSLTAKHVLKKLRGSSPEEPVDWAGIGEQVQENPLEAGSKDRSAPDEP